MALKHFKNVPQIARNRNLSLARSLQKVDSSGVYGNFEAADLLSSQVLGSSPGMGAK